MVEVTILNDGKVVSQEKGAVAFTVTATPNERDIKAYSSLIGEASRGEVIKILANACAQEIVSIMPDADIAISASSKFATIFITSVSDRIKKMYSPLL